MRRIFGTILNGYFDVGMDAFINASVHLLSSISVSLKPTPSKSHYAFNMRDIGRCVQGMLLGRALDEKQYGALWAHEHFRVFRDRLTTAQDEAFFDEAMQKVSEKYLGAFSVPQYDDAPIFDFEMSPVRDQEKVRLELEEALESHNITSPDSQMDLVFFQYAVHHIMRIGRVLKMARGHAVLVGVGGSGRQSLTRLAAHILGLNFYRAGKMKESILSAGCDDKVCVLFLTEADMRENIVAVNMLLTAGDIPGMFAPEEIEAICAKVGPYGSFVANVRRCMHVVVAAGSSFISQHRDFPSLVDCCAINIFKPWPEEALQSVAKVRLSDDQKSASDSLPTLFGRMHSLVGSSAEAEYTTTPADYLELLKLYGVILSRTKTTAEQNMQKYSSGLQKLYNTEEMVVELNKKLKLLVPTLERAKENVEVLMKKLTKDQAEAAEFKQFAQKEAATAQKKAKEVSKLKVDCQTELDEALPCIPRGREGPRCARQKEHSRAQELC